MSDETTSKPIVERFTVNGVEMPFAEGAVDANDSVADVLAVLEAIDDAEAPTFLISTAVA